MSALSSARAPSGWLRRSALVDHAVRTRPELAHTGDFLLWVDGDLVREEHYRPGGLRDVLSITKTVLGLLVGIAVADGRVRVDDEVEPGATVENLLTMTRGAGDDLDEIDRVLELPGGWLSAIRAMPRLHRPGSVFGYDNCAAHLLGAHVADRAGRTLEDLAADRLFGPLGVTDWVWPRDPEGYCYGFGHLRLAPSALLALGRLMLDDGRSPDGHQVVPAAWVRGMTTATTPGGPPEGCRYGRLTWVDDHGFFLGGWAGQHVTVLPAHRLVAVTTGLPELLPDGWAPARTAVLEHLVDT